MKEHIRRMPTQVQKLPGLQRICQAVSPYIYLADAVYNRYQSGTLTIFDQGLIIHELTHIKRQQKTGLLSWYFLYLLVPQFRIEEEVVAIREELRHIKSKTNSKEIVYIRARTLSSWCYGKAISYPVALEKLKQVWKEV